ncbi:RNA ligase family protein [Streptomyces sp. NPDC058542]|uniref:RNA ligase family protein n=1 Tax=Streptomyces sp. NPDC058542 TaxID=3346543 RepID=UPI003649EA35
MNDFTPEFREWPKTPRLFREIVITEKLDGTNAGLHISEDGQVVAQSRKRIITPDSDNYGFARWAADNAADLAYILGPGLHFGEWWGQGIQRRYGLDRKMFSVFNTVRWSTQKADDEGTARTPEERAMKLLADGSEAALRIGVVPVLYHGMFDGAAITGALQALAKVGSIAAPGFMNPEGICVYHSQTRSVFKVTLDQNDAGKWEATA